jgi:hypothetical protein
VVTDYPIPFEAGLSVITDYVNQFTMALNDQIAAAVFAAALQGVDVELVSVETAFAGHQVGDADPWLGADPTNPISFLHPTAVGQDVYRDAIVAALAS